MANIVITSTTNLIKIEFNDEAGQWTKEAWHKSSVHFQLESGNALVQAWEDNGTTLLLSFDGAGSTKQVDSINGVAPSSNSDLYDKLVTLLG